MVIENVEDKKALVRGNDVLMTLVTPGNGKRTK